MPPQPETTQERGFGPFVTFVVRKRPDGVIAHWESRAHRKHLSGAPARGSTWWAPHDRDWWIGMLFAVGSFLFGLGTVPGYVNAVGAVPDAVTFFIGSLFFTSAGFLQYREAVDAAPRRPDAARRKVFVFLPGQIDWQATAVQLAGTLEFNISTFAAIFAAVGTAQARHHVWRPDVLGSVCFLVASVLAWFEVCHGWAAWRPGSLAWWITGVNLAGSVAFGFSAVASYVVPGTAELLSVPVTNLGTFIGAVCFLAGAVLLLFERTEELPAVAAAPPRLSGPAEPARPLQVAGPVLAGQVLPEAVMRAFVVQREPGPLVDAPGVGQHVVGPQGDAGISRLAGEPQHLADQPAAYAQASGPRLHQQQPKPRGGGVLAHAEHAAGRPAVHLGDPGRFGVRVPVLHVIRDDPGHQGLVRLVPAEFLRVHRAVPLYHPAHVARERSPQQVAARPWCLGQRLGDHPHRLEQPPLAVAGHRGQKAADLIG
jgi:hypothetical protein